MTSTASCGKRFGGLLCVRAVLCSELGFHQSNKAFSGLLLSFVALLVFYLTVALAFPLIDCAYSRNAMSAEIFFTL